MCPVAVPAPGAPPDSEETVEPGRETCRHHALGTWPEHGGPGGCCWLPSDSPPRSWPPWWPRPPCCPSPNRHAGHPGLRCPPSQLSPHAPPRPHPSPPPPPPPLRNRPPRLLRQLAARTPPLQPRADRSPLPDDMPRPTHHSRATRRSPP